MKRLLLSVALGLSAVAYAQDYPSRTVTITNPNPPGGMNQLHAQALSNVLENIAHQPVPIVNRPGGTAAVGTAYVVNQPPDGYNILLTTANSHLVIEKDKIYGIHSPYSLDQLACLALLSADPIIMVIHPSMPVKTVKQLVALAKSKPNEIVYSTSGPYSILHTPIAMFLDASGIKMRHLPTTGGGPALTQALGGHSQVTAGGPATTYPFVQSGKLRAVASFGTKPHPAYPGLPTFQSLGYKNVEAYLWVGLFTRTGIPESIFNRMRAMIAKATSEPAYKAALEKVRVVPDYRDAAEFKKFFEEDHRRMAAAIAKIGKL
ncbi:MAG TPA: tripartite tricarboxylate transporter substrate binding protein [Burkholderiales bacterium]|jgi:tripartite-type tricarboxylate transporter receptor subunit TctC|nr:tripartite tricarboxylate transporter substrate binding protein [Burkholderiales bacterium]